MSPRSRGIVAACALAIGVSWNLASVDAAAEPVAGHSEIGLATGGLFTASLFLAELVAMNAIGRLDGRHGARLVGLGVGIGFVGGTA